MILQDKPEMKLMLKLTLLTLVMRTRKKKSLLKKIKRRALEMNYKKQ